MDETELTRGPQLAPWRLRLREIFWAHTDFKIKKLEGQYVDESKEPKADVLEIVVLVLLVLNMIVLGIYDPLEPHDVRSVVAQWLDLGLSSLFCIEAVLRFLSFGYSVFISDKWNLIDLLIVVVSLAAALVEAVGISFGNFTILRTVRVFRPLRSVTTLPAAKTLVLSIYSAIKSLEDVTVLYLLFIVSFSIIGMTQFMGRLKSRCVRQEFTQNFSQIANFTSDRFIQKYPFTVNYTISDFVCGGQFEKSAGIVPSIGCDVDATCSNAQFIGNRILVGYTCPWGYDCLDVENPMFGFISFDSVPQAMLAIFVGVTAEGLYRTAYQMMDAFDVTAAYFFLSIHILGTFFIVNLSVVLVTVTFEHVSAKIRHTKPKLVSKMAQSLAAGPRVFRRGGSAGSDGGGGIKKKDANGVTEGKVRISGSDGKVLGEIGEEYAYLVPDLGNTDRSGSLADVTQKLMTSEAFADHLSKRYDEELRKAKDKEEAERREREEEVKRLAALANEKKPGGAKKAVTFLDRLGNLGRGGEDGKNSGEAGGGDKNLDPLKPKRSLRGNSLFADQDAEYKFVKDAEDAERRRCEEEEERERNLTACQRIRRTILTQDNFESLLNVVIIVNIAIMCTYHYGSSPFLVDFFNVSNYVFAGLFAIEFVIKIFHFGPRKYFIVPINVFDFIVLCLAILDVSISSNFPSVSAFRAIRLLKVMKSFPGILRWTVVILVSIKSSFLLLLTIFVVNYCFAMFGMHMFGGTFCNLATSLDFRPDNTLSWCPNRPRANFDDVATAMLTTFQLMTGDNWDIIMYNSMRAKSWVVCFAYVGYVILMSFVLVNILVGILLSGPSQQEVDLIGQKLFGISFSEAEKKKMQQDEESAQKKRSNSIGTLAEWEEALRGAQKGMSAARLDLMAFAERTVGAMPRKFLDSLEAVEDTILQTEHAANVASSRRSIRRWLREALTSRLFENMMLLLLSVSSLALAFETPESAPDDATAIILRILDIVFSIFFLLEIFLNFYAFGIVKEPDSYLQRDPWNILDTILVFTNILGTATYFVLNSRWLKILLVVRAVRPLRFVKRSQGLRTVFSAFAMSAVPLKNVIFLALVIWTCWGLMGVQLFMGTFYECSNKTYTTRQDCVGAGRNHTWLDVNGTQHWTWISAGHAWENADLHFDHLGASFLSLLTLATLDGGASIMTNGVDAVAIDQAPQVNYRKAVSLFFVSFVFIGGYFLVNLVVSVIIDTYNQEKLRNGDTGVFLTASQNAFLRSHRRILHGVPQIFYDDKNVSELRRRMRQIVSTEWFRNVATVVSLVNGLLLLADYYNAPSGLRSTILICNTIFALVFALEVTVKMISLGPKRFFHSRFNQFDLFVTICVFTGVVGEVAFPDRGYTFIFRAMRSISLFRVVRNAEKLRHVIGRFSYSLYGLANVGALLFIFLYIFGVMGVKSFGLVKYQQFITRQANFNNVFRAILLLLNALAGGGWAEAMSDCSVEPPYCDRHINNCGVFGWAQAYFVLFIIFTKFVLLNMFIAVILDSFVSTDFETISISKNHVAEFFENWAYLDPQMTLRIESRQLVPFLRSLSSDNPLGFGGTELTRKIGHEFRFIQQLRLHEMDNAIELQDLITALCDATLGVTLPDSEVRSLQKYADRKFHRKERDLYIGKRGAASSRCVIERFAVHVIEQHWMDYKYRAGKRRGRVGAQSLLRSRAGEQDFTSRRDTLSFVDDSLSMWGERRDSDDEQEGEAGADRDGQFEYDEVTGVRKLKDATAAGGEFGLTGTVLDTRPELRKYLFDLAHPLLKIADRKKTKKLLEDVARVKAIDADASDDKNKEDAPELLHLLVDHDRNKWFEEEHARLQETLRTKEPLGGRLVHAERVIEDYRYRQQVAALKEAEKDFASASASSRKRVAVQIEDRDDDRLDVEGSVHQNQQRQPTAYVYFQDYNTVLSLEPAQQKAREALIRYRQQYEKNNVTNTNKNSGSNSSTTSSFRPATIETYGQKMEREKGLLSQTDLWRKPIESEDDVARREYVSPVTSYYSSTLRPDAKIPGTFAAAGFSPSRNNNTRTRKGDDDDNNNNNNTSSVISVPRRRSGDGNDDGEDSEETSRRERTTLTPTSSPFLFRRPTVPVPPASARPSARATTHEEEEEQELFNLIHNQSHIHQHENHLSPTAATTLSSATARTNMMNNSPTSASFSSGSFGGGENISAAAADVASNYTNSYRSAANKVKRIDELEATILLQELREWKSGEQVPSRQKVTRPDGYNKMFSSSEYASL